MNGDARLVGDPVKPDQIDGIALKSVRPNQIDAMVVDAKIGGVGDGARTPAQAAEEPVESWRRLSLLFFKGRADNGGKIPDVLCDQKIMLHKAFDAALRRPLGVTQSLGYW